MIGYAATPIQIELTSWQALQPLLTPVWIWMPVGAGLWNSVPGADRVAMAGISPVGKVAKWQVSQAVPDGMWAVGPAGEVGGMTTMLLTPAKVLPLIVGPWQAAQLLEMPA
jgi:hypothetical protein